MYVLKTLSEKYFHLKTEPPYAKHKQVDVISCEKNHPLKR